VLVTAVARALAGLLALAAAVTSLGAGNPPRPWEPSMGAAIAYASHRDGTIAFAVRTPMRSWGWHARQTFHSASVIKAMLLVAYLNRPSVRHRALTDSDRALLDPMIRVSDNNAASRVLGIVGTGALRLVAYRAAMRRFTPVAGWWGMSEIDAVDQVRFFLRIDRLVPARHRAYALGLLRTITPAQRWGIARVRPYGWRLYFKGGWGGAGTGWVDHQVALLTRGRQRVSVAILTSMDDNHEYGEQTLRAIAKRLLRGLGSAQAVP
jgi:Beta-lactamase enzyme family